MSEERRDQVAEQIAVTEQQQDKQGEPSITATAGMMLASLRETQLGQVTYVVRVLGRAQARQV